MPERRPPISLARDPLPVPVRRAVERVARALFEIDESRLSPLRAWGVFLLRLLWLSVGGFFRERLQIRAAALAFATVLAVVPAAALAFAVADVLGATDMLITGTIEPFLLDTLGSADDPSLPQGVRGLRSTVDGLLLLVRSTHVGGLGFAGLLAVLWALFQLLSGVEEAFAHIFQHSGPPQSVLRRARAFAIVAATTPIGLGYAVASATLSHGHQSQEWLERVIPYAPLRDVLIFVIPPCVVTVTLLLLYLELPDAQVRFRSALLGAVMAALGWYGLQLLHIRFQVSLAGYNAIYSGFGAFPILLVSIHVSWLIVLLGAQVIAAHQDAPSLRQLARSATRDHAERQGLAVRATIALGRHARAVTLRGLASELGVGISPLRHVLDELTSHALVRATTARDDRRYELAVDPATLRASTVLDALERAPDQPGLPWDEHDEKIRTLLVARRTAASTSGGDQTIGELMLSPPDTTADTTARDP